MIVLLRKWTKLSCIQSKVHKWSITISLKSHVIFAGWAHGCLSNVLVSAISLLVWRKSFFLIIPSNL